MLKISGEDVQGMVSHWLDCPVNGYLGSSYGSTLQDMLMRPQRKGADEFIAKLRRDVPIVRQADAGSVNVYATDPRLDRRKIQIEVGAYTFVREA